LFSLVLVSLAVNSFDTWSDEQNNRQPASGGGYPFTVEILLFTSALAEITSSRTLVLEKGTVASPSLGCRVRP
jgi:hypothetical protein